MDTSNAHRRSNRHRIRWLVLTTGLGACAVTFGALVNTTMEDFHIPGTQVGDITPGVIQPAVNCSLCHGWYDAENEPYKTWSGSLMAQAGRDPLFYAQMTLANQDAEYVGYYCLRCHVPMSIVTGHAHQTDGSTLDETDREGVNCHFCHSMVDPIYRPGVSPAVDADILADLEDAPAAYGNSMFVLDPQGRRRGPYDDANPPHVAYASSFVRSGDMCGTCHDVGNVAVTRQEDGTYRYNNIDERSPDENPHGQFPLERTYTEWKLSAFANGGVDMGGRFGGEGVTRIENCQDCHMPRAEAQGCYFGPVRPDLARHDFAGAAASVLDIIALHYQDDPSVDQEAIQVARTKAVSMLQRAATLDLTQVGGSLRARVTNQSGHKLPTGHIEGRRVWVNVRFYGADDTLLREYGHYDYDEAVLDEESTKVYEMHVGLSEFAANATGLSAGPTTHMALADTIVKDNRIPPRGFNNQAYAAGGAPVVGATYSDGQYWDDTYFAIPPGAVYVKAGVYYQNMPRAYIEHLRDANVTDHWGDTLYDLWEQTGKGAPIHMTGDSAVLTSFLPGDVNDDCEVTTTDLVLLLDSYLMRMGGPGYDGRADLTGDHAVTFQDLGALLARLGQTCR